MEGYILPVGSEAILLFILGAVLGSFLNVVALNVDNTPGWVRRGHSVCPKCQAPLRWYELIPLLSYLFLMGRCRHCKKAIATSYFWVELFSGLAVLGLYWSLHGTYMWWQLLTALLVVCLWIVVFLYDARTLFLAEKPLYWSLGIAVVLRATFGWSSLTYGVIGAVVGAVVLLAIRLLGTLIAKREAMGAFDAVVGAVIGMVVGWPYVIVALFFSFIIGSIYGLIGVWRAHSTIRATEVPFAPALLLGGYLTWLYGAQIYAWYMGLLI